MKKDDKEKDSGLRKVAEKRLKHNIIDINKLSVLELRKKAQELQIYQIELEIQNEELRKAQIQIEKSEQEFMHLYDSAPVGYFTVSENGTILKANLTGASMLGMDRCLLIKKPLSMFMLEECADKYYLQLKKVCETEGIREVLELTMVRKDGTEFYAELVCVAEKDSGGNNTGYLTTIGNITKRKRVEMTLLESQEKFRTISNTANDAIIMLDNDDCISFWNKSAERMFGFSQEEMIGEKLHEKIIPVSSRAAHIKGFKSFRDTGQGKFLGKTVELTAINKGGTKFPIELSLSSVKINDKWNAVGIIRDISKRKQDEVEIKQGLKKLRIALDGVIHALALTVEQRDPYTAGHQRRVSQLACAIADEMGLPGDQIEGLKMAGIVHDIGKMHIPTEILSRPGKLTKDEFNIVKSHAQVGYDILEGIEFPWPVADIVHQHHEHMDGSGYPLGLSNDDILMEARILCVADVVEAMASHRPYRPALGMDKALDEISRSKGVHYDSAVVDTCLKVVREKGFEFE